jgi:hypothetical protein
MTASCTSTPGSATSPGRSRPAGAAISTDMVKGFAAAFESAGCDELVFIRAAASPGQLELLAGAVL